MWEKELETEQRLQHIDLPSPFGHRRVSFSFSWIAQPGAWGPSLSEKCSHPSIFSPTGLVSKINRGVPKAPSAGWWLSLPHLVSNSSNLQLTDFLSPPSYTIVQSPTQSLEWHVWPGRRSIYNNNRWFSIFFRWHIQCGIDGNSDVMKLMVILTLWK